MKPQNPVEIPQIHYQQPVPPARSFGGYDEVNECEVPSNVLVARMLPSETDEGAVRSMSTVRYLGITTYL